MLRAVLLKGGEYGRRYRAAWLGGAPTLSSDVGKSGQVVGFNILGLVV